MRESSGVFQNQPDDRVFTSEFSRFGCHAQTEGAGICPDADNMAALRLAMAHMAPNWLERACLRFAASMAPDCFLESNVDVNRTALVLATHGSRTEPEVNRSIRTCAAQLAERTSFDEVLVAFHQGTPHFSQVLDQTDAEEIVILPVMTSNGYYCAEVLPRELAKNGRYGNVRLYQTAPLGVDPRVSGLVARRIKRLFAQHDVSAEHATVVIVGHGTPRHAASRNATLQLAAELANSNLAAEVLTGFLDDEPPIDNVVDRASHDSILIVPFLIAGGPHATDDVPSRVGMNAAANQNLPYVATVAGRTVICDMPVGAYKGIVDILAMMAEEAR